MTFKSGEISGYWHISGSYGYNFTAQLVNEKGYPNQRFESEFQIWRKANRIEIKRRLDAAKKGAKAGNFTNCTWIHGKRRWHIHHSLQPTKIVP
jgi:hypothetical protein